MTMYAMGINAALAQDTVKIATVQDQYPAVSPDGRKIAFESNRSGPTDQIFVFDLETETVRQLTNSAEQNETPVWSPDGSRILFARRIADVPRTTWDVFEMNADGSAVRNLTNSPGHDDHPRYSFDGKTIIFNSARSTDFTELSEEQLDNGGYNYEIYRMNVDGSDVAQLTDFHEWDTYPSISPDGTRLLWRRVYPDGGSGPSGLNSEILVADIDGKNIENLTNHPSFDGYPVWSPDGSSIAFASNRDGAKPIEFNIYLLDVNTRAITQLTETIADTEQVRPAWFPDSAKIAFNRDYPDGRSEIHILSLEAPD
ncbi:MAG: PD40 domain-containing protein [Gammaproteobacteria bacterium]|nr:PD40 domain-containing protein [Gammaproteobacteria bacterium]